MKRIEAIIRPNKQASVLAALARHGLPNVTVIETHGLARQVSHSGIYQPTNLDTSSQTGLMPKRLLLMFVEDAQVQSIIDLIQPIAVTGEPGDGAIAVSHLEQLMRIQPKENSSQTG